MKKLDDVPIEGFWSDEVMKKSKKPLRARKRGNKTSHGVTLRPRITPRGLLGIGLHRIAWDEQPRPRQRSRYRNLTRKAEGKK